MNSANYSLRKAALVIAVAAALLLTTTVQFAPTAQAGPDEWDSRTRPSSGTGTIDEILPNLIGKDWLLIQDNVPWWFDSIPHALNAYGYEWDRITSSDLATTTLTGYRGVIIPSDQVSSFHDNMAANKVKLAEYVAGGGVLVVNYAQEGWNSYPANTIDWVPGGVSWQPAYVDDLTVLDPTHHLTEGVTSSNLDGWGYSTHGVFDSFPAYTRELIGTAGTYDPTLISYAHGFGVVHVTQQTVEWGYANAVNGYADASWANLLRNELDAINHHLYLPAVHVPDITGVLGYSENFDTGTASGWQLSGLWHVSSCRSSSAPYSLAYNRDTCPTNFDVGYTYGSATSPEISLPSSSEIRLEWRSYHDTEGGTVWDRKLVYVTDDGGYSWDLVWQESGTQEKWNDRRVDLSDYSGKTIQILFYFNSGDSLYNGGEGWYVDDISVSSSLL